jgi:hypothetical protein
MNLFSTAEGTCSEVSNARDNHHAPLFFFGIRTKYLSILSMYVKKRKTKKEGERERDGYIYIFIFFLNKYSIYICVCVKTPVRYTILIQIVVDPTISYGTTFCHGSNRLSNSSSFIRSWPKSGFDHDWVCRNMGNLSSKHGNFNWENYGLNQSKHV